MAETRFTDGKQGSAATATAAFAGIQSRGLQSIEDLYNVQYDALLQFDRGESAMNARNVRAQRVLPFGVAAEFLVSDFATIDQSTTTAEVRADGNGVSLKERQQPGQATVKSTTFTTSDGTINQAGDLYQVTITDGGVPTGVFDIELVEAIDASLLIFDICNMPGRPQITVEVSQNGASYNQANTVTSNGYRILAWVTPQSTKFVRLTLVPSLPDTLNGSVYTFGITDFHAQSTEYHLRSDWFSKVVDINPVSLSWIFSANADDRLVYFLSLNDQAGVEVNPGDSISVPGAAAGGGADIIVNDMYGSLVHSLNAEIYPGTLKVVDNGTGVSIPIAYGVNPGDTNISHLTNTYILVYGNTMFYRPYHSTPDKDKTFKVSYIYGPSSVEAKLHVQLSTPDKTQTPIFTGATLEAI